MIFFLLKKFIWSIGAWDWKLNIHVCTHILTSPSTREKINKIYHIHHEFHFFQRDAEIDLFYCVCFFDPTTILLLFFVFKRVMDLSSSLLWLMFAVCTFTRRETGARRREAVSCEDLSPLGCSLCNSRGRPQHARRVSEHNFTEEELSSVGISKEPKAKRDSHDDYKKRKKKDRDKNHVNVKRIQLWHWILRCLVRYRWFSVQVFFPFLFKLILPPAKALKARNQHNLHVWFSIRQVIRQQASQSRKHTNKLDTRIQYTLSHALSLTHARSLPRTRGGQTSESGHHFFGKHIYTNDGNWSQKLRQ